METIQVITLLAGNYDSIAKKDKIQKDLMINTWYECLNDLEYAVILQAVKKSMIESPFPPTIHEIRKNAIEIINPSNSKTAVEAWNEAIKMISNSLYITQEEFNKYSPEVRRFFGSVNQLKQLGMIDITTINTVTKGQFLKQYEGIVKQKQEEKLLPTEMQNYIKQIANKFDIQKKEEQVDKNR